MIKGMLKSLDPRTDAITLLKEDHRKVEALFSEFESARDSRSKERIVQQICKELTIHAKIEERIFYPRSKQQVKDAEDQINEGFVEHEGIKRLVGQLAKLSPKDEFFETRVKVLKEYVRHHVKEEEHSMFPAVREGDIDLVALGDALQKAKQRAEKAQSKSASSSRRRHSTAARSHASRASA